jgi:hypothetical protein
VVLDVESLRERLGLDASLEVHTATDPRAGTEHGLVCREHQDAVMGLLVGTAAARVVG